MDEEELSAILVDKQTADEEKRKQDAEEKRKQDAEEKTKQEDAAEERRQQIAEQEKNSKPGALARTTTFIADKTESGLNNADMGVGGLSYYFVWVANSAYRSGQIKDTLMFLGIALILGLVKHKLPAGSFAQWLKKPTGEILKNISETIHGRK